jgi:UDP-glucose 4-epimerase
MKALVIGGNGFIGTNLVDLLLKNEHQVRVFDRYPSRYKEPDKRVEYVTGDIGNHGEMLEAVKGSDWVFHLAYTTLPQTSNDDPGYDVRSNLIDTLQLMEQCSSAGVRKLVFISSGGTVYGIPQSIPITEEHATEPICSYGVTKLAIEKYLNIYQRMHGLEYVVLRLSNPYGERQNPNAKQGAIGVFLGNVATKKPITIWGDGEVLRDYIYIGDAVEAMLKAAEYQPKGPDAPRLFNIGDGHGQTLNQIVAKIREIVDLPVEVQYTPGRQVDVPANVLDITRAREVLGWAPKVELREGLLRTWNWIKSLDPV